MEQCKVDGECKSQWWLIDSWIAQKLPFVDRLFASMEISFFHVTLFVFFAVLLRRLHEFLRKPETPRLTQLRTPLPSSVSSAPPPQESDESRDRSLWKYDVFLSFRGTDSRRNFVSHLYEALTKEGIKAFHDDRELQRGGFIWEGLVKAIDESPSSCSPRATLPFAGVWKSSRSSSNSLRRNGSSWSLCFLTSIRQTWRGEADAST